MSTNDIDSDTEAPPQEYYEKTQEERLGNAILDFGGRIRRILRRKGFIDSRESYISRYVWISEMCTR